MYLNTKGLVVRVTPYNETDAILSVLTPTHGKLAICTFYHGLTVLFYHGKFSIYAFFHEKRSDDSHGKAVFYVFCHGLTRVLIGKTHV